MSSRQATLARPVSVRGVGLHSGAETSVRVCPAAAGHGVVFVRTDLGPDARIPATIAHKADRPRRTAIRQGDAEVHTVEHLMAPLYALGIDNARVEIDGVELPGLDGSGLDYLTALESGGRVEQDAPAEVLTLAEPVAVSSGAASAIAMPAPVFAVSYTLKYSSPAVPVQFYAGIVTAESFRAEIAGARTFCLEQEAEALQKAGLGLGANLQNTLVIGDDGLPLENTLRFGDEFVRHKVLDLIGDLALLGKRLRAHVIGVRSGHALNARLAQAIQSAAGSAEESLSADRGQAWEVAGSALESLTLLRRLERLAKRLLNGAGESLQTVESARFGRAAREGERLELAVERLPDAEQSLRCRGSVRVGDELLVEAQLAYRRA